VTSRLRLLTTDPNTLQAEDKLAEARQALAAGHKLEARHGAWEALAVDRENVKAWLMLAALASPRASVNYIKHALELRPHNPVAQRALEWAEARLIAQGERATPSGGVEAFQQVPIVEPPPPESQPEPATTLVHAPEAKAAASALEPPATEAQTAEEELENTPPRGSPAATLMHDLVPLPSEASPEVAEAGAPPSPDETVAEVVLPGEAEAAPAAQGAATDETVAEITLPEEAEAAEPRREPEPEEAAPGETVAEVALPEEAEAAPAEPAETKATPDETVAEVALPVEDVEEDESPTSPHKAVSGPKPSNHTSMTLLVLAVVLLAGVLAAVYLGHGTARAARPAAVAAAPLDSFQKSTLAPAPTDTPTVTPSPSPTPPFTPTPSITPTPPPFEAWAGGGEARWIDVNLSLQELTAMDGESPVETFAVSTGLWNTPTVTGDFHVYVKYPAADMSGPGYYLPQVPYVMYFYRDYGIHGTYWHNNFGHPMSHGCVNMRTDQAGWLYNWASVGTLVHVHD
jgi:lipoprotein-anchoring transpeptidase ErfK/SrfK